MKIDVDELSPVQRKVRVELPKDKVALEFSKAYQTLAQRVRVKGFRAGKAPRSVLQGMYGGEIKGQVQSQLVEDSLGEAIKEHGLQIVSRPEIEADELVDGSDFSFSAVFEIKPEIELKDYLGIEVEKINIAVTDEQVDQALKKLQEGHARLEPVENRDVVQAGDFVSLSFTGKIEGKEFPGGKADNYLLEVGAGQTLPEFDKAVAGARRGEAKTAEVNFPENYPNRDLAGKPAEFSLVVQEIKQKVLPALDDDFAKEHGECDSLDELKAKLRVRLEEEFKKYQDDELKERILSRVIEIHAFTPPPALVERQTRYLMERYQDRASDGSSPDAPSMEETRKALEARATRQVQATLLVEKIAQSENIEVPENEVQERIESLARAAGERGKTIRQYYSKHDAREEIRSQMVFDRTLGYLLEKSKVKVVDAPPEKVDDPGKKS
ncbi:MAG: trigger factor [Deltaproteobacteria bacterium]|nr:trigger factor [Deltaproteobacteria bacterium]